DRRLSTEFANGGYNRAFVPRVRDDLVGGDSDLAGRLADGNTDDVRLSARRPERICTRATVPSGRAILRRRAEPLRPNFAPSAAMPGRRHVEPVYDTGLRHLFICHYS